MEPPRPPSPPSGPPSGTNFSRRKESAPAPPSPALTWSFAVSKAITADSSGGSAFQPRHRQPLYEVPLAEQEHQEGRQGDGGGGGHKQVPLGGVVGEAAEVLD